MTESFKKILEESLKNRNIKNGSITQAKIIKIKKNSIIVDAKLKSESNISIDEFKDTNNNLNIKINDKIDVLIEKIENGYGETILSYDKAKKHKIWLNLKKTYEKTENINGTITNKVKGGFTVDLEGIKAFLPGSLVDIKPIKDYLEIEGKKFLFKIIKLDKTKNNIVVSRKAVILTINNNEREKLIKNIHEGLIIKGMVKNITDYGAFIDLGGLDGLLHITDMSWKRIKHPNEIIKIGENIKVKIIKFDTKNIRVSLGLKQLTEDPWKNINNKYPINSKIKGIITNITDYGCFIKIEEGIEGLAHISEINWINKNINPFKTFNIKQKIEAIILNINIEKRRISLSIKQCIPNPWKIFEEKYKKNDQIHGIIKSVTDFGIFINLENNINGLIHTSDISWNSINIDNIKKTYIKGNTLTAIILQIDVQKERISLGLKQLTEDPINKFLLLNNKNIIKGKITKIKKKSIILNLENNIKGKIKINDDIKNKFKNILKNIKINKIIKTKIINIDKKKRTINLIFYKEKEKTKKQIKQKEKNYFSSMIEAFKTAKTK